MTPLHISTADNEYVSTDAPITPPQSSIELSLPQLSEDVDDSNARGHRPAFDG
jgi:hypothetical protein